MHIVGILARKERQDRELRTVYDVCIGICRSIGHSAGCSLSRLPERVREGHDGVADELELRLELRVGGGEALAARAAPRVVAVVRRRQRPRVAALEVVLPELCNGMS